jgi:hypothetical protein
MVSRVGLVIALMLVSAGTAVAGFSFDESTIWLNGGVAVAKSDSSGQRVNGPYLNLGYEMMDNDKPISVGFNFGYLRVQDWPTAHRDTMTKRTISSAPLLLGGKYWLGKKAVQGYFGLALGVYITSTKTEFATRPSNTAVQTGFGVGIPVGATVSLGTRFALNFNYTLNWLWSENHLQNDLAHAFNAGVGFRFQEE